MAAVVGLRCLRCGSRYGPLDYAGDCPKCHPQAPSNLVVEYAILNWLRLQSNLVQGASTQQSLFRRHQGSGADLIFLFTR